MRLFVAISLCCLASSLLAAGAQQTTDGLSVLAKLNPSVCNYKTGYISDASLAVVKQQAAAQGLVYLDALPTRCWHAFKQASSSEATSAAIASLSLPGGYNITLSLNDASIAATTSSPFALARVDKPLLVPTPIVTNSEPQPQALASAAQVIATPASTPTECPGAAPNACPALWGMNKINVANIWQLPNLMPFAAMSKKGTIVDTGVDYAHADLQGQVDKSISATFNRIGNQPSQGATNNALTSDSATGHGTHVIGTAAGGWGAGDTRGIAGILGPTNKSIVSCNAFTPGYYFSQSMTQVGATEQDLVSCYSHAKSVNAHYVVNLSLGGSGLLADMALAQDAIKQHICDADGIVVVAAGNEGLNVEAPGRDSYGDRYDGQYPAKFAGASFYPDCVIAVAAIDSQGRLADFSNWGPAVAVAAPGVSITSDVATKYSNSNSVDVWAKATWSGTSMSTPHVTAVALLLRNAFPTATAAQVVRCIKATATTKVKPASNDPSGVKTIGGGILDAWAAYNCVKVQIEGVSSPSPSPQSPSPSLLPNSTSPSPTPTVGPVLCPSTALPACVDASTGSVVIGSTRCPSKSYCTTVRSSSGTRYTCSYAYQPAGYVCSPASNQCVLNATCSGTSSTCPRNARVRNCSA